MPGGVIEVPRRERPGLLERLYLPTVLRGLRASLRRRVSRPRATAPGARGMPLLVADEDGAPRCVACGLCALACPARCIDVVPGEDPSEPQSGRPDRFDLDLARCILCGLCEEACPEEAIVMSSVRPPAVVTRDALRFDRDALLVPAELVADRIAFLRGSEPSGGTGEAS